MLYDLSSRTIGGDYWEQRGDRLKPDEARKWFEKAKKVGEEKWLLEHAVPKDDGGPIVNEDGRPEVLIVRVIGAKYPKRLPEVYRALLKKPATAALWGEGFINPSELVVLSKLPREQKIALLEEAVASNDTAHCVFALEGLARLDRELLRKHLLTTLKRIRLRVWFWEPDGDSLLLDQIEVLVALSAQRECWDGLAELYRVLGSGYRMNLLQGFQRNGPLNRTDPRRRECIRFLIQFLDDQGAVKEEDETTIKVRDSTATQLAGLLGFPVKREPEVYWPVHDRTRGPFSRAFFRAAVWQAAARELAAKP